MKKFWQRKPKAKKDMGELLQSHGFVVIGGGFGSESSYYNNQNFSVEGFCKNDIVNRCLRMRGEAISNIPIGLFDTRGKVKEIDHHPLLNLINKSPNPAMTRELFFRRSVNNLAITGNLFYRWIQAGNRNELWIIPSANVKVKMGGMGLVDYYEVTESRGNLRKYPVDQVTGKSEIIHIYHDNPLNPMIGLSELAPLAVKIQQYNAIALWNAAIMTNGGKLNGIISVNPDGDPNTQVTLAQKAKLEDMISQNTGAGNQGKIIVTDSAVKFQELGINAKDLDWINGANQIAAAISAGLGVPSQLINIPGSQTYNNYQLAFVAFHVHAVFPNLKLILHSINNALVRFIDENLEYRMDSDDIDSMNPARERKWAAVNVSEFITTNEKREALGYDAYSDKSADKILISGTKTPIEDIALPIDEPDESSFTFPDENANDDENNDDENDENGDDDENNDTNPKD